MSRRHEDVVRQLTDDIARGTFAEGSRLPAEQELALRLGAGRGAVREAIRTLEARGLVAVRAGHGVTVRSGDRWDLGDVHVLLASLEHGAEPGLLAEAVAARAAIERASARAATTRATEADLRLLRDRLDAMRRALAPGTSAAAGVRGEVDFHHALALIGANRVLASVAEPLHEALALLRARRAPERAPAALVHHQRILEGVSSRDPELAAEAVAGYARALSRWLTRGA
jgi:DNA-binding FadR family transcriptional regulator